MSVTITSRAIPSNPRSKNYPSGAIVYNSGGDSTTVIQGGGESVDVIGKDDFREMTDKNVLSSLRALAEIRSRIIKKEDNTPTGDDNVFSSLRTLEEVNKVIVSLLEALEEKYLSKTRSDRTPYSLEVGEDLTVDGNASVNHDLNVGRNATIGKDLTVMEILHALIKIETAALSVSGNSKTGTLDVAGKATARDVEVANQVTSLNAVIRALATIHNLTVDNTADIMHGIIRQYLSSDKFVSGFLGEGFKVWKDAAGLWHGELDMLTVRKTFTVFELVVQKIVHQGGMVIRSAAGSKITKVTDGGSYWRCEHDSTDDFVKDDQVLCQVFTGTKMKRYWRLVTSAGAGYFNLSKTDCEAGSATPEVDDEVAVLGNRTNAARQSAQIDCAVGANAPYRDDYAGINSYSLVGKLVTRTGNLSGIVDPDFGALSGYGLYSLNAYLKGMLRLTSGKTVETAIGEARSGAISVAATDAQAKANAAKASAIAAVAGDAQAKADAAKQAAISAAASDAQSKAMAAETNAKTHAQAILDALQIGGRNLYRKSTEIGNFANNPTIQKEVDAGSVHGFKLTGKQSLVCGVRIRNVISENGDYVISFWGKSNGSGTPKFDICNNPCTGDATFTTEWRRFELRAKVNNYTADGYHFIDIENIAYLYYWFKDFKVEKGTKATDWTPAPEDVEAGIAFEITKVRTDFDVREGQISSKVAEVTAKTQQAVSAAETATSKANDASGAATRAAGSATAASGSASAAANEAGKAKSSADTAAAKLITVTEKESNINQTAGQIATKVTEVTKQAGIASQAANNASGSASAAASSATTAGQKATDAANSANAANTALQTISTKQTQINQTAAEIDLKATRAEQAAGKAEAAEARINLSADGIVLQASKQAAQLAVDGVQIGGRNLLRNAISFHEAGWNNGFGIHGSGGWIIDNTVTYNGKPTLKTLVGNGIIHPWVALENGAEYTYSAMVRTEVNVTGDGSIPLHWHAGLNNQNQGKIKIISHDTSTVANQWKLIRITFKLTSDANSFRPFIYRGTTGGVNYWIAWLKLEKGNKATDGTPAPEDTEVDATAKANAAKQAAISDAAAKYPTKTEYSAQLAVLNNSISSKVSQTDFNALSTRMSTAEQKITPASIISTVSSTVESAKTAAINAAASDAKAKADAAKSGAISAAASDAQAKANAAKAAAISAAAGDAQAKADAAKQAAISDAAAKYPTKTEYSAQLAVLNSSISSKVSQTDFNALSTRMSTAEQKITPASIISTVSSTVESAKTAAINAAASDAQAKADAAKSGAISAAATDAQAKANAAKAAAISAAAGDATAKADAAKQAAISTAANDATAKANAAEANAKAHANNTFTPITTYNTKVAQLENLISLKAESSTVNGLTTRMAAAEAKITPDAINLTVKEQITTAVGNVQVGGRNYVILSKLQSWIANTSVPVVTGTDVNVMLTKDNTTNQQVIIRVKGYVPDAGAYYTVSGYMTLGGRPIKNSDFRVKRMNHELGTDNFRVDDSTGYFECTHKYNGSNPWLLNAKLTAATGTPVKISKFKFEKGTKATDWTLSPEDADAALQIGGRNLYRKSTVIHNLINNPTIQKEVDAASVHGFKLTGKQSLVCGVRIRNVISENGDYVISFWGKSNAVQTPKFDICNSPCTGDATFTTEWKRFELRAKVNNYSADVYHFIDIEKLAFLYYWFKDFKVEKGTKATDWTPAPEDVEADVTNATNKANAAQGAANNAQGTANSALSTANGAQVAISNTRQQLLDTGIDITTKQITVTAPLFRIQDNSGTPIAVFKIDASGKPVLQAQYVDVNGITAKDIKITGSVRCPFTLASSSTDVDYSDNVVVLSNASGTFDTVYSLPWDATQSGRRITLVNYKWDWRESAGYGAIYPPYGKRFYEDGREAFSLSIGREVIELLGYGDNTTFYGWIVLNRRRIMSAPLGKPISFLAQGIVTGSASGATIRYKAYDNAASLSVSRVGEGKFRVSIPYAWGLTSGNYMVTATGVGAINNSSPAKACVAYQTSSYFEVWISDDATLNDGSFNFVVWSLDDWHGVVSQG